MNYFYEALKQKKIKMLFCFPVGRFGDNLNSLENSVRANRGKDCKRHGSSECGGGLGELPVGEQ